MDMEIIAIIALFGLLNAGITVFLARTLAMGMKIEFRSLDEKLAQAIQGVVEGFPMDVENQVTPAMRWLMEVMKEKVTPSMEVKEIQRAEDGKFKPT